MTDIRLLMDQVKEDTKSTYSKGEVRCLLNQVSSPEGSVVGVIEVESLRRGDVFSSNMSGKRRPWLTLSNRKGVVVAVAISSANYGVGFQPSKCRLWSGMWVGTTVSVFEDAQAKKQFMRPYTNKAHIREVEVGLANLHYPQKKGS